MYENLNLRTADYDYDLPEELIAQEPAPVRDHCRMLVMDRATGALQDRIFADIVEYLRPGDLLAQRRCFCCGSASSRYVATTRPCGRRWCAPASA